MSARSTRVLVAALGAATALAASVFSVVPAFAADGDNFLGADIGLPVTIATSGGPGKVYFVTTAEQGTITDAKVTIDFSGIAGLAIPSFPLPESNCTITGSTATCPLPDHSSADFTRGYIPLKLVPTAGAVDGATGSMSITSSDAQGDGWTSDESVAVKDGPDLVVNGVKPDQDGVHTIGHGTAKPGDDASLKFSFTNLGTQTATDLYALVQFSRGFVPDTMDNCEYADMNDPERLYALCKFAGVALDVNQTMSLEYPGHFSSDAALTEYMFADVESGFADSGVTGPLLKGPSGPGFKPRAHTGRVLKPSLAVTKSASKTDIDTLDNFALERWSIDTTVDLQAIGAKVVGSVGDKVTAKLGVRNVGPSWINAFDTGDWIDQYTVTVPAWAVTTKVPPTCDGYPSAQQTGPEDRHIGGAGWPFYKCTAADYSLLVGQSGVGTFTFKIKADHGDDGIVAVDSTSGAGKIDARSANNTAKLTLVAPADGGLPVTGSRAGIVAGSGALLVLIGAGLVVLGRRRRATTVR